MDIVRARGIRLHDGELAGAGALFGVEEMEPLLGFENAVYRSTRPAGRILRITHTSRRSVDWVRAEFEFMEHLAQAGVPVVRPVRSAGGRLVEPLETGTGQSLLVACMTEAPGARRGPASWSIAAIEAYGGLLAAMHRAAASFAGARGPSGRPGWTHPVLDVHPEDAASRDPDLHRHGRELRRRLSEDPAGAEELLIHRDAHLGNLHLTDDGEIMIFDFDDCAMGTAVQDIAIILFHWVTTAVGDPIAEARGFLSPFLRGYERAASLPADWTRGADLLLRTRELELYWLITMDPVAEHSDGDRRFLAGRRERILSGEAYLGAELASVIR